MKISLNWLKDYIECKNEFDLKIISSVLIKAGLEVEEVHKLLEPETDYILTLSITPNRADALSHMGVAREISQALDLPLRSPMTLPQEILATTHEKVHVNIEDEKNCSRYACRVIESVKIKESPAWLKNRLKACGIEPINNVVDATNYVMLARGQPLHAFDYNKLSKEDGRVKILIRSAKNGESINLLNGKNIELSSEDIVVADNNAPIALAGIMGSKDSAISDETTNILLEAASFDARKIRLTAKKFALNTESSFRFERGVDQNGVIESLNYAARLISEIGGGKVLREPVDMVKKRIEPLEVKMRMSRAKSVLGLSDEFLDEDVIRRKFLLLGIETVAKRGDAIYFRIPTFRADITREIDLIEEVIRTVGYDNLKSKKVLSAVEDFDFIDIRNLKIADSLRNFFTSRGFFETVNYSFGDQDLASLFVLQKNKERLIEIKNPLSKRHAIMMPTLIPGLLLNLSHNLRNQEKEILLFEVGTVFLEKRPGQPAVDINLLDKNLNQDSYCLEEERLSAVLRGKLDFYYLKGLLESSFRLFSLSTEFPYEDVVFSSLVEEIYLHPGMSATIYCKDIKLGVMGKLHPDIKAKMDIDHDVYVFELMIENIAKVIKEKILFKNFSRFPKIERDVAFLVDESIKAEDLLNLSKEIDNYEDILKSINIFDIYRGANLGKNKKSVAVSLILQSMNKTLTDEEVNDFVDKYIDLVKEKTGASLRE